MRPRNSLAVAAILFDDVYCRPARRAGTTPGASPGAAAAHAPAQAPPQAGQDRVGADAGSATFPAQQRTLADPAIIARGKTLFEINCRLCHGADLRGGDMGGVNLLRSNLVLTDQHGELILPVVKGGRQNPGMPRDAAVPADPGRRREGDCGVHPRVAFTMRGQGNPPPGRSRSCSTSSSATRTPARRTSRRSALVPLGDRRSAGRRDADLRDPVQLQNAWVAGRRRRRRTRRRGGGAGAANRRETDGDGDDHRTDRRSRAVSIASTTSSSP